MIIYNNGNYQVQIHPDGTKIRTSLDNTFKPRFPETLDINISNHCIHNCPMCYIDANTKGKHGKLSLINRLDIPEHVELAINYAQHPDLVTYISDWSSSYIVNMTCNLSDFKHPDRVAHINQCIQAGITAIGLSVSDALPSQLDIVLPKISTNLPNLVIHCINGITPRSTIEYLLSNNYKVLILGFKHKGRGKSMQPTLLSSGDIKHLLSINQSVLSFDNLALTQLDLKSHLDPDLYSRIYMGNDGSFSMYIDTVSGTYNTSSTACSSLATPISSEDTIRSIFKEIQ